MYSTDAQEYKKIVDRFKKVGIEPVTKERAAKVSSSASYIGMTGTSVTDAKFIEWEAVINGLVDSIIELQEKNADLLEKLEAMRGWTCSKELQQNIVVRLEYLEEKLPKTRTKRKTK